MLVAVRLLVEDFVFTDVVGKTVEFTTNVVAVVTDEVSVPLIVAHTTGKNREAKSHQKKKQNRTKINVNIQKLSNHTPMYSGS